jgi:flavin reductase (DIM6/NTAB) family NADH-FMN oxidoreductase RutF
MYFYVPDLNSKQVYKLLSSTVVPRPIAWVVTCGSDKVPNAAPFSFFNFFSGHPPVICLGMGYRKGGELTDSLHNIELTGECVVNLVSEDLMTEMNTTAVPFKRGVNELALAGLETHDSVNVTPPRIARSPVALECRLKQMLDIGETGRLVVAHVVAVHVMDDAVIDAEKCYIDSASLHLVGRMESPGWYTRTNDRFKLKQIGLAEWERQPRTPPM